MTPIDSTQPLGRNATTHMRTASLTRDQVCDLERQFKAIGSPARLRILLLLAEHQGKLCVKDLIERYATRFGTFYEQGPFSAHLRTLVFAKLVDYTREGYNHYYYLRPDAFQELQTFLIPFASAIPARLEVVR